MVEKGSDDGGRALRLVKVNAEERDMSVMVHLPDRVS